MMMRGVVAVLVTFSLLSIPGPPISNSAPTAGVLASTTVTYGPSERLGNGTVRTYLSLDSAAQTPISLGVEFSGGAMTGLSQKEFTGLTLLVPEGASATPIRFVTLFWNPEGHIPPGIYDVPHFDVHFYINRELSHLDAVRAGTCAAGGEGVDCETFNRGTVTPPPSLVAAGYRDVGAVVPGMGNHLIDLTGQEFQGKAFTHSFIYGLFDGEITFIEPMLTRAFLLSKPNNVCTAIKQPAGFDRDGWYPTQYCLHHVPGTDTYQVSLDRFVLRQDRSRLIGAAARTSLCRDATADELKAWADSDLSLREIIDSLPVSPEGVRVTVIRSLYVSLLRRDPVPNDCPGLRSWVDSNASIEAILGSLISSNEYRHLPLGS